MNIENMTIKEYIESKIKFIDDYAKAINPATGSVLDANANITKKTIATLSNELYKDLTTVLNKKLVQRKLNELFPNENLGVKYEEQLNNRIIYTHDTTSLFPYCCSISLYPFLLHGLKCVGGESSAPEHLASFCSIFTNLLFAISAQFAGAVGTPEFLMYFDHFARNDYGDNYLETQKDLIDNALQHVVYTLNQPAAARGQQSIFWNIAIFDSYYFNGMFESFCFPDGKKPNWATTNKLQQYFLDWLNIERTKSLLTFPVITVNLLKGKKDSIEHNEKHYEVLDQEWKHNIANMFNKGSGMFIYMSDSIDSLASCCRLHNSLESNEFSHTLGAGGIATGSLNVITMNVNRLIQDEFKYLEIPKNIDEILSIAIPAVKKQVSIIHMYQFAHRKIFDEYMKKNLLEIYNAGFIQIDKQFLTVGVNGMVEAAEYLGVNPTNNYDYILFLKKILEAISSTNKFGRNKYKIKFNTEFVPAENLGVKNAKWDKQDNYKVLRDCYNSYFFPTESDDVSIIDKFVLHGEETCEYLDGGSALHLNLQEYPTIEQYKQLLDIMACTGCNYMTTNILITICNTCGYIDKHTRNSCIKCNSTNIDYATRIIGYLKRITNFSKDRQEEAYKRIYHNNDI
jgi:anaerobic ribonucleoside-triphosphate reductase